MLDLKDREMLIRIDENVADLRGDVGKLDKAIHGNGRPGALDRLQALETSHRECKDRLEKPRTWPAVVAAICAICAVVINIYKMG